MKYIVTAITATICFSSFAVAQSSSLYLDDRPAAPQPQEVRGEPSPLNPHVAAAGLVSVGVPEPRAFAVHDLITVIVLESTSNNSNASIETEKTTEIEGEISDFPNLSLRDILNFQLRGSENANPPRVGVDMTKNFEGDGSFSRSDSFVARLTAEVIDVKPNGTLVLAGRKFIQTDEETQEIFITGTCRAEDVTVNNTVTSEKFYDLHVVKRHEGELREVTNKGLFTRILEGLFAF